ncbi:MAG TPA: peptidoglycan DD-metalloendopeptidase family protein [Atribacteraceae bacterium]|nr:peptidoglycan DD-metalloendopeptidase family protein [Atribacteraceae bacterium]
MSKRLPLGILVLVVLLMCSAPAWTQETSIEREIDTQLKELERIKQEQAQLEKELRQLERAEQNVVQEVRDLEAQIEELERGIAQSRNRILQLEEERSILNRDIERLSGEIEANQNKVRQVMVRAYKFKAQVDVWDILLGATDPNLVKEQWYLLRKYVEAERVTINRYLDQKTTLQEKLDGVIQRIRLEVVLKEKLVLEDRQVESLNEARRDMLSHITSDRKQFERSRTELVESQRDLQNLIAQLQEEMRRAREGVPSPVANLPPVRQGRFFWPVSGGRVIRGFGEMKDPTFGIQVYNPGIDIAANRGTNIYAAHDGVVILARSIRGYGRTILIDHGSDVITMYAHLDEIRVNPGDMVSGGGVIGTVGDTGLAEQPMVHFEVRVGTDAREENPMLWLQQ